ncbi:MAG: CHAT domain-containing protein [Acidobacteriota bacterium]
MRPTTRAIFSLFAFASWLTLILIFSLSAGVATSIQTDETALRAMVEKLYADYARKDIDGYCRVWGAPNAVIEKRREFLRRAFASVEKMEIRKLVITRLKIEGAKAEVRIAVELNLARIGQQNAEPQKLNRLIECAADAGVWKVLSDVSAEDRLATQLAATKTDDERAALLASEPELVNRNLTAALIAQADQLANQGEFTRALAIYGLTKKVAAESGDQITLARASDRMGDALHSQGDYSASLTAHQQALEIVTRLKRDDAAFAILNNIGYLQAERGDYDAAIAAFQQSLGFSQAASDRRNVAKVLTNISNAYGTLGNNAKAMQYLNQSLALSKSLGDKTRHAIALNTLAKIHLQQGEDRLAEEYFRQSLALLEGAEDQNGLADMLGNLGVVEARKGRYEEAIGHYQRSLALREKIQDKTGIARILSNIGDLYQRQKLYPQALDYYEKSQALREELGTPEGIALVLTNKASLLAKQKNYQQAAALIERALSISNPNNNWQNSNRELLRHEYQTAGEIYALLSKPAEARSAFEQSISIIEELRMQVAGNEQQQEQFFENKLAPYLGVIQILLDANNPQEALAYAERAKARVLLDVLQSGRVKTAKAMTTAEQDQERRLNDELAWLNTQFYRERSRQKSDPARLTELSARLQKARDNHESFRTALYAIHPELQVQRGQTPVFDLQRTAGVLLDPQTALLEYVAMEEKTFLFVVTASGKDQPLSLNVYPVEVGRSHLDEAVEKFRRQLANHDLTFGAAAVNLHNLLVKPATAQLRGKTKLIIVRDAGLWELPFQALRNQAGRFLIEDFAVSYAPSLTALVEMAKLQRARKNQPAETSLLAFGNPKFGSAESAANDAGDKRSVAGLTPLPSTQAEVTQLAALYGAQRSKIYVGAEAREERLKAEAGRAGILHLATHAVLNDASPMYSQIVLAQPDEKSSEDGLLEAWEVMNLNLRADLVVLSACETGRGRIGAGEGLIGLTWAFFVAGAPSTVVSQWKVDAESTSELMQEFHRRLRMRQPSASAPTKAEALREAELKLLRNPKYRHPFYWASFSIIGEAI